MFIVFELTGINVFILCWHVGNNQLDMKALRGTTNQKHLLTDCG